MNKTIEELVSESKQEDGKHIQELENLFLKSLKTAGSIKYFTDTTITADQFKSLMTYIRALEQRVAYDNNWVSDYFSKTTENHEAFANKIFNHEGIHIEDFNVWYNLNKPTE